MDYKKYHEYSDVQAELSIRKEQLVETLKFFVLLSNMKKVTFLKYDFKFNHYRYDFTVDGHDIIEDDLDFMEPRYSIILKDGDIIFGKMVFNNRIWYRSVLKDLLQKTKEVLRKIFEIEKDMISQNTPLNIFVVSDTQTLKFAQKLQTNLDILLNADIKIIQDISRVSETLNKKNARNIIIYTVQNEKLIKEDEDILQEFNEFVIVIGPNRHNLSLLCGRLNILNYTSIDEFSPETIKNIILETKYKLLNKNKYDNKIICVAGISGGIGSTVVSMNTADILAHNSPNKNVLFIDLSTTKAISNLFLSQNPVPEHSIIDLVNLNDFNLEKDLEYGLVKIRENFYAVNGIQKHIDRDILEKDVFIDKLLDYIMRASEHFNYIIIDTGSADSSALKSTIYDLVNELWILTEMTLPHVSKLKTFYALMKRAGLKEKVSFVVNRVNSLNEISYDDFESIMNSTTADEKLIYSKIPNDYETLGQCWNYCELAHKVAPESIFVKELKKLLIEKNFINEVKIEKHQSKSLFSFLKRVKS